MRYKTVIFDFDGTICDTGEGILKSAKFALDYYNIEAPDYTAYLFYRASASCDFSGKVWR